MEAKINIAEILKDKPTNTKLYSPLFGNVYFSRIIKGSACVETLHHGTSTCFYNDATYLNYKEAETLLFPSKEMRDWNKFAWKKGDVLISNDSDEHIIFKGFSKSDYTTFEGKHWISVSKKRYVSCLKIQNVQDYYIEDNKESAQTYINTIEKRLGGKLNRESLEIEKAQTEFKDGDIVALVVRKCTHILVVRKCTHIAIFQSRQEKYIGFHAVLCQNDELLLEEPFREDDGDIELRPATDSEKQQLFEALAKEGKAWDAEKKQIVDLPKKCEFKPFDKCVWKMQGFEGAIWQASFISYVDEYDAVPIGVSVYDLSNLIVLPYNEETAHLLGTTDEWKGGEG